MARNAGARGAIRDLTQEIYLQDLVLEVYRVYARRMRDAAGRGLIETYLRAEADRRRRIERHLATSGAAPPAALRRLFAVAGAIYGRVSALLGTRVMLRIALSASGRASRRACARLDPAESRPEMIYLATLRARNEGELREALRQHLIDTAPRRG